MRNFFRAGLATVLLAAASGPALAQINLGVGAGFAASMAQLDYPGTKPETSMVFGPMGGAIIHIPFGKLALQPGLQLVRRGFEMKYNTAGSDTTFAIQANVKNQMGYLELPLNLVFTTGGDKGFQIFAGGYVALGLGGKRKVDFKGQLNSAFGSLSVDSMYTTDVSFDSRARNNQDPIFTNQEFITNPVYSSESGYFQRMDYGVQGGLGYKLGRVQIQATAQMGLRNLYTNSFADVKPVNEAKNMSFRAMVSYFVFD